MYLYRVCDRTEQKQRGGRKPERKVRNLQDPFMLQSAHFRSKRTPHLSRCFCSTRSHIHIRGDRTTDTIANSVGGSRCALHNRIKVEACDWLPDTARPALPITVVITIRPTFNRELGFLG